MKRVTKIIIFIGLVALLDDTVCAASRTDGKDKIIVIRDRKTICRYYYGLYVGAMNRAETALKMMSQGIPVQSQFGYNESIRQANSAQAVMARMRCGMR